MGIGALGIHGSATGGGENNTGANVGAGTGQIFRDKTGVFINLRTLLQGTDITITTAGDEITINSTAAGQANTMSTDGTGVTIVKTKVGVDLPVRSFVDSTTIDWVQNVNDIIASIVALSITDALISATAGIALSKLAALAANRALATDASGFIIASLVTDTELNRLDGITSALEEQGNRDQNNGYPSLDANARLILARLPQGTDSFFFRGNGAAPPVYEAIEISKGGTHLDPVVKNIIVWRAPFACTVTNVRGYRVGGTGATINARKNGSLNLLAADLSLVTPDVWAVGAAPQNTAFVAGDKLEIMIVSVTATPSQVAVQVDFTRP